MVALKRAMVFCWAVTGGFILVWPGASRVGVEVGYRAVAVEAARWMRSLTHFAFPFPIMRVTNYLVPRYGERQSLHLLPRDKSTDASLEAK